MDLCYIFMGARRFNKPKAHPKMFEHFCIWMRRDALIKGHQLQHSNYVRQKSSFCFKTLLTKSLSHLNIYKKKHFHKRRFNEMSQIITKLAMK